jgi:hypothetical protein
METIEAIDPVVIRTNNFESIFAACDDAREYKKVIVITSPPGYGKTTALVSYKRQYGENVVLVKAFKSQNPGLFYSSIFNSEADENYKPTLHKYFAIRKAASVFNNGRKMLLIIDEAGKFKAPMLEYVHEFRDLTKGNTGIIVAGVDYFKRNLDNWNEAEKDGIPEFYSRINDWIKLEPPTEEEIINIIHGYKIYDKKLEKECLNVKDFRELTNKIKIYLAYNKIVLGEKA